MESSKTGRVIISENTGGQFVEIIIGLFLCVIFLSLFIRRIHDHNKAGWYCLLSYVPIFGIYVLFLLFYMPGKKQVNKFGHGISGLSLKAIFAPGMISHKS
jgi:uncharacterized membrane protein YhaH (DUF805 family)